MSPSVGANPAGRRSTWRRPARGAAAIAALVVLGACASTPTFQTTYSGPMPLTSGAHAVGSITGVIDETVDTTNVRCGTTASDQYTVYLSKTRAVRINRAVDGYPLGVWVDDLPNNNYLLVPSSGDLDIKPDAQGANVDVDLEDLDGGPEKLHVTLAITC